MRVKSVFATASLAALLIASTAVGQNNYSFKHFAGNPGGAGYADGTTPQQAMFNYPYGVAVSSDGVLFVADSNNYRVRRIDTDGSVSTVLGNGNSATILGNGSNAGVGQITAIAIGPDGMLYIANHNQVFKLTQSGTLTLLAGDVYQGTNDGVGVGARFTWIQGLAVDSSNNVYASDGIACNIRRITPDGTVTSPAGLANQCGFANATGTSARFNSPYGMVVGSNGNLYIADQNNGCIRQMTPAGVVTTLAGSTANAGSFMDGTGTAASFNHPMGITIDPSGNFWIADAYNHAIRKMTSSYVVTTQFGTPGTPTAGFEDGTIATARLQYPVGIAAAPNGDLFVGDQNHALHRIRGTTLTTVTGVPSPTGAINATGSAARFERPFRMTSDASGNLYVTEFINQCVRKITPGGVVSAFAGACSRNVSGFVNANGTSARFNGPGGLRFGPGGNLYVVDANNACIRMITPTGDVTTWSIGGYIRPSDIVFDTAGNAFVTEDYTIKRVDAVTMAITVFAGSGSPGSANGTGTSASFDHPNGIAIDASNNLYVAEYYTHRIRKITPGAVVTTLSGAGTIGNADGNWYTAQFWSPLGIEIGPSGDLYVADTSNSLIRRVNLSTGFVTTEGGVRSGGGSGAQDGVGTSASFNQPTGITFDPSGRMYVADQVNHCIRVGLPVLADTATIDAPAATLLTPRQLDTSPQTAPAWTWNVIRRPGASHVNVSDTSIRNPTFTPDVRDLYIFEVDANNGTQGRISRVQFRACEEPAPPSVTSSANPSCPSSSVTLTASDGYSSYVWSTGATTKSITVAPSATTSYTVTGYDSICPSAPATYVQNVFNFDAPTNVNATPSGPNKITVSWTASAATGVHHYQIYRSPKACGAGAPFSPIGTATGTSFDDTSPNAGGTYAYQVRAVDANGSCPGPFSGCDDAIAYGACSIPPLFSGLTSVTANGCLLRLSWPAATSNCPSAPTVVYDVYRSTNPSFVADGTNLIARCITNTFFDDNTAPAGTSYYIVHAEDAMTTGRGSCTGGNEDTNTTRRSGAPVGGVTWNSFYSDTFDAGGRPPSPDTYWTTSNATWVALSTCRSASPTTSYKFGPAACSPATYAPSLLTTLTFGNSNPTTGGFVIPSSGARLRFNKMIQAESGWDGLSLYYSTSPTGPWTYISDTVSSSFPYVATGAYTGSAGGIRVWTGTTSTAFSETTVNLNVLANQRVWFQWKFTSDGSVEKEGIYLDDVTLEASTPLSCPVVPAPVTVLTATTRNAQTQIDFITPATNYASTTVRYQIGLSYPMTTTSGGLVGNWTGTADAHGSVLHQLLTNGTTYSYSAFVASPDGQTSPIHTVRSRPIDTTGQIKWVYNTGATATSAPGIGAGGNSFVASNDRAFHSFVNGAAGGSWPPIWKPSVMNGPSQSRTLWFEMFVGGVKRQVVAIGSHDGRVYLVDANNGSVLWASPILGEMVQASPVAISTVYGAPFSLVMVGSRSADGSSNVYGLHPDDGHIVWTYDNSAAVGGENQPIGIINDAIVFDYTPKADGWRRAYFTSRAHLTGSGKTLWCLKFNQTTVSKDWAVSTAGDIDAFPMPLNGILYVGNTKGEVWAIRQSDQSPVWGPIATNDGGIKVTLWPDAANNRLYFSTTNYLWCIGTDGVIKWQKALPSPSTPNRFGNYIYLGAGDGKLYEISNLLAPTAAGLVVKSVTLGDPATPGFAGETTLDRANGLIYVGTDSGSVYAVSIPLP